MRWMRRWKASSARFSRTRRLRVAASKALIRETAGPVTEAMREDTASRIAAIRATDEAKEGRAAFFEKRKPAWIAAGSAKP